MRIRSFKFILALLFLGALCLSGYAGSIPEIPPVYTVETASTSPDGEPRYRALGPLFEYRESGQGGRTLTAFRPLWSQEIFSGTEENDFIWPLSAWRYSWHSNYCWVLLYFNARGADNRSSYHLIPVWFSGDKRDGGFYWCLFPVYGETEDIVGYDKMFFLLFPLYWEASKNDVSGEAYVWPIVNMDRGKNMDKCRIFPFYAYNHKYDEQFNESYLWPFVHNSRSLDPKKPEEGWMFWPFTGKNTANDSVSWSVLWPLFEQRTAPENGYELTAPWPFFIYRRNLENQGDYQLYAFPFYGQSRRMDGDYKTVLWPIVVAKEDRGDERLERSYYILPFYWTHLQWNKKGVRTDLYRRFWPFASYAEKGDDVKLKVLDIWPQRDFKVIDRNWSPLWTIYEYDGNKDGFAWDFLWGLVRHHENKNGSRFSLAPFYNASWKDGEERTEREIFFGILCFSPEDDRESSTRLFWSLDF